MGDKRGFKEYEIDKFCFIEFSSGKQLGEDYKRCSICLVDFSGKEKLRLLPCMHRFHPECIDPWLSNTIF